MTDRAAQGARPLGFVEAVAAAGLWGSSGIFAVHLFRLGVPPESVAMLRPVVGLAFLLGGVAVTRPGLLRIDTSTLFTLGLGGGTAVGVFQLAYQLSTDAVGVPTTVALLYLAPAIVTLASGPLLGEWPTAFRLAMAALTLGGVWLSVLGAEEVTAVHGSSGLAWGLLAAASYATYTLFGRHAAPRYGATSTVVYSTAGACVLLAIFVPFGTEPLTLPSGARAWVVLIAFGALTIAAAQFLFFDALGRIEAANVSIAAAVEPAVAAVLATFLLAQGLRPVGWIGIALVIAGVAGIGLTTRAMPKRPG
ncbi:MAG TPA: DMT family transporter [Longimicrobiales bacterium]|nr:DMT family transporter [Longimicrobiales bacterium]